MRDHLSASTELPDFLATAGGLSLEGRKRLIAQALVLMESNFVHLPLKRAMHGIDPIQRLKLVRHRLDRATPATMGPEFAFHREMIDIFTSVRDLHTNYLLPDPFRGRVAFLPFDVEEYFDADGTPRYVASHFVQGFTHSHFKPGVEVLTWNGNPIERAVEVTADLHAGSNADARHARGLDGLTIRSLTRAMPPDAMWVDVGYVDLNGTDRETRQEWIVSPALPINNGVDPDIANLNASCLGLDIEADAVQRAKLMLFAPKAVEELAKPKQVTVKMAAQGAEVPTLMPSTFRARSATTTSGEFGIIRIFTFNVNDPGVFIDEFIRLVELLPQNGLIVDVRGNGGGHIHASEGLLQTMTPSEVTPEPTQFISTPLNTDICARHNGNPVGIELGPWEESLRESVETGSVYSRGFSITPHDFANARGQQYHGPVVLITDARCYSATDIFAAGFQDHRIGHILGVDGNTGAGGANVWTHSLLKQLLELPPPTDPETPFEDLPNNSGLRVAIRRTLRVNEQAGTPLEDLGVKPGFRHALTREDLLSSNVDLINRAGEILTGMKTYGLTASVADTAEGQRVSVTTLGLDRLDFYIDGRPFSSHDVGEGTHAIDISSGGALLRLDGFDNGLLAASRRIVL
ncbi:S41 family peptidase [Parasedimentitalea marina]|uniref:S41 family peptidase n=1 Tax=Parasedimentitalea marina TaxID=2483033 RepID=UPI00193104E0|nr:S41 family peptidase [Parasedimentitalea marina]